MQVDAITERVVTATTEHNVLLMALRANQGGEAEWLQLASLVTNPAEQRYCLRRALVFNERNWQALGGIVELGVGPLRYPAMLEQVLPVHQVQPDLPLAQTDVVCNFDEPALSPGAPCMHIVILCLLGVLLVAATYRLHLLIV